MTRLLVAAVVALASAFWISPAQAAPQITSVTPSSGPTAGGIIITISGTGFGAAGNLVPVGGVACPVTGETTDAILCTLPEGSGASRPIRVVGGGQASPPFPFAYDPPSITNITAASFPTAGGLTITINGENFGPTNASRDVMVGSRRCVGAGVVTEILECTLPPGDGHDVPVEVTVDGQTSPPGSLSYDPPAITAVTPTRGPAAGGARLTLTGNNFGSAAAVTVAGSSCPIESQSDTRVECVLPPPGGAPTDIRMTVGGQGSNAVPFSYGPVASKCDAAKFKSAASYAQCLANAESKAAKKGLDADAKAVTKCDDKFTASCAKAESDLDDCSQLGTCAAMAAGTIKRKGWDGLIYGNTR